MFLLTKYVMALAKDERWIFLSGSLLTRKKDAFHLVRTVSPTYTEVRVFMVFVNINAGLCRDFEVKVNFLERLGGSGGYVN